MNRDGAGVLAHEVHGLAADILSVGWNDQEPRPIAIELDEVQSQQVEQFNHRLVANSSSGLFPLAPVGPGPGTVKYGSVSASHTNSVLRLFRNGCSTFQKEQLSCVMIDGKLSLGALRAHDRSFHDAAQFGMEWTVIGSQVVKAYPQIAGLLQQASNTGGQLARAEGELQLGRRMFNVWTQLVKLPGKDIPFKTVKSLLLRSKPQCAASIPFLWAYLLKFGGGQDARHFFELAEFVEVWGCTQRTSLGSEVWDLLSQDCKVPGELLIRVRHAILRLLFAHTDPKYLTLGDIKRIFSQGMVSKMVEIEKMMAEVRQIAADGELPKRFYLDLQFWEQHAIEVILDKRDAKHFKGSVESAIQFHLDYIQKQGGPHLTSKWESFRIDETAVEDKASKTSSPASKHRNFVLQRDVHFCF